MVAQADSTKISFIAYWSKGDSYDFKVSKVKREWEKETLTKKDSSQYIANFKVLDSTESSYKIQWTFKNNIISSFQENSKKYFKDKKVLKEIIAKNDFSKIIYKTNEFGEFIEIVNWEDLAETTRLLLEEVIKSFEDKDPVKIASFRKKMQPIVDIYTSQSGIEQLALKELQYFHYPFGLEYDVTQPIEYEQDLKNMLGGKPIRSETTLTFEEVDFENYYCSIKEESELNSQDSKRVIKKLLKKMGLSDSETKKSISNAFLDIKDLNYYQYYYYPGVPHYIYGSRKSILKIDDEDKTKIDEIFIELIYEE